MSKKDDIRTGYYVRVYYKGFLEGNPIYIEGRVTKITKDGFFVSEKGVYEFIKWGDLIAYKLGRYG